MNRVFLKNNLWFFIAVISIVLCLASSLIRIFYSLPWFDEVFLADITNSLLSDNTYSLNLLLSPKEVLTYGPVYFYAQKIIVIIFGFGMWQFRLLNLLSGISIIIIILILAKRLNISKLNFCLLLVMIAFDSRFMFNMTSGRMDLFSLVLFMWGWLLFQNSSQRRYLSIIVAGILSSLSFLTTPRIGFYFLVYLLTFAIEIFTSHNRKKSIIQYLVFGFTIFLPVFVWIYSSYGNIANYINYIFNNSSIAYHYGGLSFKIKYQIPIIFIWFLSGLYVFKSKRNILNPLVVALYSFPVFHLLFIKEVGPYSAMMMPFIYLGIIIAVNNMQWKKIIIIPGLIACFLFLFSLSSTFNNIASVEFTKPYSFRCFFGNQKIVKENVLADFPYYYVLKEYDNRFISFYNNKNELNQDVLNVTNIQFAVITKDNYINNSDFFSNLGFRIISEYIPKKGESFFYNAAVSLGKNIRTGYDGYVLKRDCERL